MATRKRTSRRSGSLVGRAVSAGRRALREAESRVPPDLRRQLERRLKDADKTARAAIKSLETQVRRASTRADVNSVLKRIDGLTKQARQIARGAGTGARSTSRRATTTAGRTASRTRKTAGSARTSATRQTTPKKTATRKATTRRTAARKPAGGGTVGRRPSAPRSSTAPRRASSRRATSETAMGGMPEVHTVPMSPESGGAVEMGEVGES